MIHRLTFLPIAIGLAFFPSVEYRVLLFDGPDTQFYGFPLPWNSRFIAGSLAKDIYVLPLLLDAAFFLLLGYYLWRWWAPRLLLAKPMVRGLALAGIWAYGLYAAALACIVVTAFDCFPHAWYDHRLTDVLSVRVHPFL